MIIDTHPRQKSIEILILRICILNIDSVHQPEVDTRPGDRLLNRDRYKYNTIDKVH